MSPDWLDLVKLAPFPDCSTEDGSPVALCVLTGELCEESDVTAVTAVGVVALLSTVFNSLGANNASFWFLDLPLILNMALNLFTLLLSADFGRLGGLPSAMTLGENESGSFVSRPPSTASCMPPSSVTSLGVGKSVVVNCTDGSDGGISSCGDFAAMS